MAGQIEQKNRPEADQWWERNARGHLVDMTTEDAASRFERCSQTPRIADAPQAAEPHILVVIAGQE